MNATVAALTAGRALRRRHRIVWNGTLAAVLAAVFTVSLMVGNTFYPLSDVVRVIVGLDSSGAAFTVGELRLPRAVIGVLAGASFGMAGATFQTMLRNPLASPDIVGVSAGASTAAVVGTVVLGLGETGVSLMALTGALLTAFGIYWLASRHGFSAARLILIGIGMAAVLNAITSYLLSQAAAWDLQSAMQWLTGSLNSSSWDRAAALIVVFCLAGTPLLLRERNLGVLRLGDDAAGSLGVNPNRERILLMAAAVTLLAFATAAAGPISFVAFMSGPIAARLVKAGGSLLIPAGLVGALLVLAADLVGQWVLPHRYPVGVVTGALGAPYLVLLLIRTTRQGGSL